MICFQKPHTGEYNLLGVAQSTQGEITQMNFIWEMCMACEVCVLFCWVLFNFLFEFFCLKKKS